MDIAEFKIMLSIYTKRQFADLGLNFSSSDLSFRQVHLQGGQMLYYLNCLFKVII